MSTTYPIGPLTPQLTPYSTGSIQPMVQTQPPQGVWVARYPDRSVITAFPSELEALRHAISRGMEVAYVEWGHDLLTADDR